MALITESITYHSDIYKIETTDPVLGGNVTGTITSPTAGHANAPIQGLADRTAWLNSKLSPVGEMLIWPASAAPSAEYLTCDGSSVTTAAYPELHAVIGYAYGGSGSNFNLPDMRGMFLRGWDNGAGIDPDAASRTAANTGGATGDNIGSVQDHEFESHLHGVNYTSIVNGGTDGVQANIDTGKVSSGVQVTTEAGGNETRPTNTYVNFIIRAKQA